MSKRTYSQYINLYAAITGQFPDNTTRDIVEGRMRDFSQDNGDTFTFESYFDDGAVIVLNTDRYDVDFNQKRIGFQEFDTAVSIQLSNPLNYKPNAQFILSITNTSGGSISVTFVDNSEYMGTGSVNIGAGDTKTLYCYVNTSGELKWMPFFGSESSSPTTTKGDVIAHDGSSDNRVPVGSNDQILVPDSGESLGVKWTDLIASLVQVSDAGSNYSPAGSSAEQHFAAINTFLGALDQVIILIGTWDASVGTFPGGGTAQAGHKYIISVAGTVDSVDFQIGDTILAITDNASTSTYAANWLKSDNSDNDSQTASQVPVTATPTDYDEGDGSVEGHLSGINNKFKEIISIANEAFPGDTVLHLDVDRDFDELTVDATNETITLDATDRTNGVQFRLPISIINNGTLDFSTDFVNRDRTAVKALGDDGTYYIKGEYSAELDKVVIDSYPESFEILAGGTITGALTINAKHKEFIQRTANLNDASIGPLSFTNDENLKLIVITLHDISSANTIFELGANNIVDGTNNESTEIHINPDERLTLIGVRVTGTSFIWSVIRGQNTISQQVTAAATMDLDFEVSGYGHPNESLDDAGINTVTFDCLNMADGYEGRKLGEFVFPDPDGETINFRKDGSTANIIVSSSGDNTATLGTGNYSRFIFELVKVAPSTTILFIEHIDI